MQRLGSKVIPLRVSVADYFVSTLTLLSRTPVERISDIFSTRYHLDIGVPTLHVLLYYHLTMERVPRKIRSPGERTNKKAVSCSVSPACSARLIKTIRAATANDKRLTWLLDFISTR
ncbi:hypothetical protein ALC56_00609 [Trachymyrmex septentrionalis]|uniref:Uncharacterized protein n=1 Tax=Trachymyrmex septentrionalis TaxID=34720 RepID=A0A195FXB7_9HYME|nr:hypothetical protein ALC56_00609 [Trachymyrmex septentrionalis]